MKINFLTELNRRRFYGDRNPESDGSRREKRTQSSFIKQWYNVECTISSPISKMIKEKEFRRMKELKRVFSDTSRKSTKNPILTDFQQ